MDRALLVYFSVCIPIRLILVLIGYYIHNYEEDKYEKFFASFFMVMALTNFFADIVRREYGFLGQQRWWISSVHGLFYVLYFTTVMLELKDVYLILLVDVVGSLLLQFARIATN